MKVVLVRHADAVSETATISDEHRYLSARGREEIAATSRLLVEAAVRPTRILASPLVRAVQTAELLAARLAVELVVEISPALAPSGDPRAFCALLGQEAGTVVSAGHEPSLSAVAALLCKRATFRSLAKAEAVMIEDGVPRWTIDPGAAALTPWRDR